MASKQIDLSAARWRTSSHSNGDGGNCVEIGDDLPGIIPVRDTKDRTRATLIFGSGAWDSFVSAVKGGALRA
ncbi:DUF397 domain-containing protein [Streptomyces benahoarensis]|uniref:DUF397 domain-containing protein n=1 Tax=Streptomyces benahoarensis TaxID=2595054 RepID=A0A553Z0Y5_9ACTN|nr:DUF397 domain-containing protein [Streptomyces benahoarensis]TSB17729.1 DUF397 domain-containing protein [Streptomyces benahoarensis]TSB35145.1 DUF397 domain-containing protein [Streptomyces benahoarensis]